MYNAVLTADYEKRRMIFTAHLIIYILSCLSLHKTKFTTQFIWYEGIIVIYPCRMKLGFLSF